MSVRNIVFFGNFQAAALANVFRTYIADPEDDRVILIDASKELDEAGQSALANADLAIIQRFDFPTKARADGICPGAKRYEFPTVRGDFLWPFGRQPHPRNMPKGDFGGAYPAELGDAFLNQMLAKGVEPEEAVARYLSLDIARQTNLDRLYELNMIQQRQRDAQTDFKIADLIEEYFRDEALFRTTDHPNARIFCALFRQLCEGMGVSPSRIGDALEQIKVTPFNVSELPIHPGVIRHFGLKFANEDTRYRHQGQGRYTFAEYVLRYMRLEFDTELEEGIKLAYGRKDAEALPRLTAGVRRTPRSAEGHHALSVVLARQGRLDEAIAASRQALAEEPDHQEARFHLSELLVQRGDLAAAERELRMVTAQGQRTLFVLGRLAVVLARLGKAEEAAAACRDALACEDRDAHVNARIGNLFAAEGWSEAAETLLRRAAALAPSVAGFHHQLGGFLLRAGRHDEAAAAFRRALTLNEQDMHARVNIGRVLLAQGALAEAEPFLRQSIEMDPQVPALHDTLANVLLRQGRIDEAVASFRRAIELGPDNPHVRAHFASVLATRAHNDLAEAEQQIRRAIEINPQIENFHRILDRILAQRGKAGAVAAG
jgi:Tfp pilus assembly protein PilF